MTDYNVIISVIVPVYKVELYLARCIDSIISQTYKNLDIILVNDGSPDKSGLICDKYAAIDNRVRVIHKENGGVSSARNIGIEYAIGEYICFVDSDDWIEPNLISWLFQKMNNVDLAMCGCIYHYSKKSNCANKYNSFSGIFYARQFMIEMLWGNYSITWTPWGKLFKTDIVKQSKRFSTDIHVAEDKLFFCNILCECNKVYYENVPLYHYVVERPGNSTQDYIKVKTQIDAQEKIIKLFEYNDEELLKISIFQMCDSLLNTYRIAKKSKYPKKDFYCYKLLAFKYYIKSINYSKIPLKHKCRVLLKIISPIYFVSIWSFCKKLYMTCEDR